MAYNFSSLNTELDKAKDWLKSEYSQVHTGLASPALLDGVQVESYGSYVPINTVASISIEDPKTLLISPWDSEHIKSIEKAVNSSNLGLSTSTNDSGVRVIFPQLTTETRSSFVKILKEKLEEARIRMRSEREKVWGDIQSLEKSKEIAEDEKFRLKDELQKIMDSENKELEDIFNKKESEVMG